jgi:glycosyltransferase involved in cell wall biosynthesis
MPGADRDFQRYLMCDSGWNGGTGYDLSRYSRRAIGVYSGLERRSYSQIRHFFPMGDHAKQTLVDDYGVNKQAITVVGSGRGKIAPFHGKKDYARGPILFVAKERFEDKGGVILARAFEIALRKAPHLRLVMAGHAVNRDLVGNVPNITVAGHIPWDELQRLFETAALFAMPARWEPWGLVYLEALACKTPLLGLARNSLPELTQNGRFGFLVSQPDPEQIAAAILDARSDARRLERMGSEGQAYCLANFSWELAASKIRRQIFDPVPFK